MPKLVKISESKIKLKSKYPPIWKTKTIQTEPVELITKVKTWDKEIQITDCDKSINIKLYFFRNSEKAGFLKWFDYT